MIRLKRNNAQRIDGIGEDLPDGEVVLWQGTPAFWPLLKQAFHFRLVAAYFVALFVWRLVAGADEGTFSMDLVVSTLKLIPLAGCALGLLALIAWLTCKTTIYAITSRRIVMRLGIALSVTFNLPFRQIHAASVKRDADGIGDLTIGLGNNAHIAYLNLWPHAKPWALRSPEPMLRAIDDVNAVAAILAKALAAEAEQEVVALPTATAEPSMTNDDYLPQGTAAA